MKHILLFLTIAALPQPAEVRYQPTSVRSAERIRLKTVYTELGVRIKDLETWLAENDSTSRRNLPPLPLYLGRWSVRSLMWMCMAT
jgi:hypothetical protein